MDTEKIYSSKLVDFIKSSWFDPHTSFLRLPSFWVPTALIVFVSGFVYLMIYINGDYDMCWSEQCVNDWVLSFKVPIAILALLIPVLGLLNANHKSEQAKASMELTRSQNNFVNYYKHLDEFAKYIDEHFKKTFPQALERVRLLYDALFPNGQSGEYHVSPSLLRGFQDSYEKFIELYLNQLDLDEGSKAILIEMYDARFTCSANFHGCFIRSIKDDAVQLSRNNTGVSPFIRLPESTLMAFINQSLEFYEQCDKLMGFGTHYDGKAYPNAVRDFLSKLREHPNKEKYRTVKYLEMK